MPRPNRRTMIATTSAAIWGTSDVADADGLHDKIRDICLRYLAMEDRVRSLLDEWPVLESRLAKVHPGFLGIPLEAQVQFPGGSRFLEIQDELDALEVERERLLPIVLRSKCETADALIAKLTIVTRLIHPDDHPEAHKLLTDSVEDLGRVLST